MNNNGSAQSDGSGNAMNTGSGSGNAMNTGSGSGNAMNTGSGSGNAMNTGSGSGNSTNTGKTGSLSLEELTMEYKMTLMMYNQVQSDYLNYLKDVNDSSEYTIIGAGTDGHLYSSPGVGQQWSLVPDGGNSITGVCTGNDGKTILACAGENVYTKPSWDSPTYTIMPSPSCCVTKIAQASDGTIIGVGTDNTLWSKVGGINATDWTHVSSSGEYATAVCIAPDESVYIIGAYTGSNGYGIYKKKSYKTLASESWQLITSQFFIDFTIMPNGTMIGVGTDNNLYTYANYKLIVDTSKRVGHGNCCVVSVTTVFTQQYAKFKGKTFWGSDSLLDSSANTIQDCQALCSSTSGCSGATFNSTNSPNTTCQLRSGDGDIAMGQKGDYAFMVEGPGLLKMSQQLNSKLADLNNQIFNLTTNSGGSLSNTSGKNNAKKLMIQSQMLKKEREKLSQLAGESTGLDEAQEEGDLMINANYYSFVLLSLLAVVFVIGLIVLFMPKAGSTSATAASAPAPAPATAAVQSGGKLNKNVLFYVFFGVTMVALFMFPKHHGFN
jgi:hypothetical protein